MFSLRKPFRSGQNNLIDPKIFDKPLLKLVVCYRDVKIGEALMPVASRRRLKLISTEGLMDVMEH